MLAKNNSRQYIYLVLGRQARVEIQGFAYRLLVSEALDANSVSEHARSIGRSAASMYAYVFKMLRIPIRVSTVGVQETSGANSDLEWFGTSYKLLLNRKMTVRSCV